MRGLQFEERSVCSCGCVTLGSVKLVGGLNSVLVLAAMQHYGDWKVAEVESRSQHGSGQAKLCLDFETLALRVEPPVVSVEEREDATVVTVDSANMPGILVEVSCRVHKWQPFICGVHSGARKNLAALPGDGSLPSKRVLHVYGPRLPLPARLQLGIEDCLGRLTDFTCYGCRSSCSTSPRPACA